MKVLRSIMVFMILASFYFLVAKDFIDFKDSYKDVNAYQAHNLMKIYPKLKVVDISGTFDMGHIPGSMNLFIGDGSLDKALQNMNKKDRYLVYYHSNKTSKDAAQKFADAGFKKVYRLDGNFSSWVEAGFKTASI